MTMTPLATDDDVKVFLEVCAKPPMFEQDDDATACKKLLSELSEDEQLEAAKTSYSFWYVSTRLADRLPSRSLEFAALKGIRRHWIAEHKNYDKTLDSVREMSELRKKYNVDKLRTCFYEGGDVDGMEKTMTMMRDEYTKQRTLVRGAAKGASIAYQMPRTTPTNSDDNDAYTITQVYTSDRAMATTEFMSKGDVEMIHVISPFKHYKNKNRLTIEVSKSSAQLLQRMYPERMELLIVLEPSWLLRTIVAVLKPLLRKEVTARLMLVNGEEKIKNALNEILDDDGGVAPEHLMDERFGSTVDIEHYLTNVPFYRLYDDFLPK